MRAAKVVLFLACLAPLAGLAVQALTDRLGANPIERVTHATGEWTLRFLLITLAVAPARELLRQPKLIRFRRMLGLFAFLYASLHFLTYLGLDQFFDAASILKDLSKRPFITAGFAGFVMLVPLAITSTAGWIRRLGGRQWRLLHRLAYVAALAGVVHFWWLVKSDITRPVTYAMVLSALLGYRIAKAARRKAPRKQTAAVV